MTFNLMHTLKVSKSNSTLPRPTHSVDTYGAEPPVGGSQLAVAQLFNMTTQCHTLEQGGRSWQAFGERKDALISFIGSVFAILRQKRCFCAY